MDRVEPAQLQAFRQAKAGEHAPLRTAPGALSVRSGAEHELRDPLDQGAQPGLAVAQRLLGGLAVGDVEHELDRGTGVQHPAREQPPPA